jgi:hypothetical protein
MTDASRKDYGRTGFATAATTFPRRHHKRRGRFHVRRMARAADAGESPNSKKLLRTMEEAQALHELQFKTLRQQFAESSEKE